MTKRNKKTQAGRLRIVAGKWRSRLLEIADVDGLRPTTERIRETLFNWLTPRIHGSRCLDLCAGTGALGLEALSRGASEAIFVEKSALALRFLRQSIDLLDAQSATVVSGSAEAFLKTTEQPPFDVIFIDPPYAAKMHDELCRLVAERNLLAPDGLVYIEFDKSDPEPELPASWIVQKEGAAGSVRYRLVATIPKQEQSE